MNNVISISKINSASTEAEKNALYCLAQELVDIFITLDENQTDDLSFFYSPLKPRGGGLKNNLAAEVNNAQKVEFT